MYFDLPRDNDAGGNYVLRTMRLISCDLTVGDGFVSRQRAIVSVISDVGERGTCSIGVIRGRRIR